MRPLGGGGRTWLDPSFHELRWWRILKRPALEAGHAEYFAGYCQQSRRRADIVFPIEHRLFRRVALRFSE